MGSKKQNPTASKMEGVFTMNPVRIKSVTPFFEDKQSVHIIWQDGKKASIKLDDMITKHQVMKPLMNMENFNTLHVGEWGWSIAWKGDIDIGTERLRQLAEEQQQHFRHTLRQWRKRHHFTYDKAAIALGISRRSIGLYENGQQPIPKHIALACKGWEAEHHA